MYLRAHTTQVLVREVHKEGWYIRVDREEGGLRDLEENVGKKSKHNLECSCEGRGWLTVLPRSHYGTEIYREGFR